MGTDRELTRKAFLRLSASATVVTMTGCFTGLDDDTGSSSGAADTEGPTMSGPPAPSTSGSSASTSPLPPDDSSTTGIDDPSGNNTEPPGDTTTSTGGDEFPQLTSSTSSTGTAGGAETAVDCSGGASHTTISDNHGHAASIDAGMLIPGTPIDNLDIQADADHAHTISLTGGDVDMLLAGMAVTVTSSLDGHAHDVTLSC